MNEQELPQTINRGEMEKEKRVPFVGIGLALLFAAAAFFSGLQIGEVRQEANLFSLFSSPSTEEKVDLSEFWEVWNLLDERFVSSTTTKPVSDQEKLHGAIEGLVRSYGDPYTVFFPPAEAEIFESDINGNFEGVGMEVGIKDGVLTVIAPLPESPASRAGILAGDRILKIDDTSTEGMNVDEGVKLIRGEKGTKVTFTLLGEDAEEVREITVERDTIIIPTSEITQKDGVYIIKLFSFSALAEANVVNGLRDFVKNGHHKLVLDLRGNPGGFLQSAVNIASYFLPAGKVVVRENFGPGIDEEVHRSAGRDLKAYYPFETVILVDRGSASAAEILAGALKEHGVATVIGTRTFGKGSVQELVELEDGSSLKVTIARWLTPNGVSISEGGLSPDIEVEYTDEDRAAGRDPQLEAAIKYLNGN